ncbi:MAG: Cof-type HAD-IIB family hydrolase [Pleomorphochaeta sp.]
MNKLKNLKAIILDLDGTLLNPQLTISEDTKNTLIQLRKSGVLIIIATGRTPQTAIPMTKDLNINVPMVLANGALIFDPLTEQIIDTISISENTVSYLFDLSKQLSKSLNIYTPNNIYLEDDKIRPYMMESGDSGSNLLPHSKLDLSNEKVLKCEFYGKGEGVNKELINLIKEKSKVLDDELYVTSAHINYLEILNKQVNKYSGIINVLNKLGLKDNEVLAFGDSHNDLEMLDKLPNSVAMGNAGDNVKQVAKYVTKLNSEDGIAYFIKNNTDLIIK